MSKANFPKSRRLLRHADFERVYKQGRRHFAAHMTVFYLRRAIAADVVINPKRSLIGAEFGDLRSEVAKAFGVIERSLSVR